MPTKSQGNAEATEAFAHLASINVIKGKLLPQAFHSPPRPSMPRLRWPGFFRPENSLHESTESGH